MPEYLLSALQQQEFQHNGYLRLRNALPKELLEQLKSFTFQSEQRALKLYRQGHISPYFCISDSKQASNAQLIRYNNVYLQAPRLILEILSCSTLRSIAHQLCGCNALPLSADILFKQQYPNSLVLWHQDAPTQKPNSHIVIGIYLDEAQSNDGCLRYVKGSHHKVQEISQLEKRYGWLIPNSEECPAKAGDIIIHHAMTLHGSGPRYSADSRRTLYIEMQTYEDLQQYTNHSKPWIILRQQWQEKAQQLAKTSPTFEQELSLKKLMEQLIKIREPGTPANYSTYPTITSNYPVTNKGDQ